MPVDRGWAGGQWESYFANQACERGGKAPAGQEWWLIAGGRFPLPSRWTGRGERRGRERFLVVQWDPVLDRLKEVGTIPVYSPHESATTTGIATDLTSVGIATPTPANNAYFRSFVSRPSASFLLRKPPVTDLWRMEWRVETARSGDSIPIRRDEPWPGKASNKGVLCDLSPVCAPISLFTVVIDAPILFGLTTKQGRVREFWNDMDSRQGEILTDGIIPPQQIHSLLLLQV